MRTRAGIARVTVNAASRGLGAAIAVAAALTLGCPLVYAEPQDPADAEADEGLGVGTRLQALDSVTVSRAEISKGATVSVTRILHRQGHLASVDVELADGHVARVPIATVRSSFRVVGD